jgi:hypothetical protein
MKRFEVGKTGGWPWRKEKENMGIPAGIEPQDYYLPDNVCEECGAWAEVIEEGLCPECLSWKLQEEAEGSFPAVPNWRNN